jgi:hypothetical protein
LETAGAKPSGSTNKWLIGLGIGCGAVVFIIIVLGIMGYFFVKNITQGFRETEATLKSLSAKYGQIEAYCPNPDGSISADRIRVFLSAREAAAPLRRKLEASFETLSKGKKAKDVDIGPSPNVFSMIKTGVGVVPQIAEYFKARNQALLDAGMGMGEYYYIYVIAYHSWLKKPPDDGPGFRLTGPGENRMDSDDQDAHEYQQDLIKRRAHRTVLPMLQNQFAKLTSEPAGKPEEKWRQILAAEIKALEADRYRLPWQDGVPDVLESSLKPFQAELEVGYSRMTNVLEISFDKK